MINRPNRSKPLLVIIAILLLANIGGLAYFLASKPTHKKNNPSPQWKTAIANYLKNDVGFDTVQLEQYERLKTVRRKALDTLSEQLKAEKENRLHFLADNDYADSAIMQAVNSSAENQKMLDLQMLRHLKDIRSLCTPVQKARFDTSIYKVMARRGGDKKKSKKQ
jgi:Spy/CpxP family protein refolding chaperone